MCEQKGDTGESAPSDLDLTISLFTHTRFILATDPRIARLRAAAAAAAAASAGGSTGAGVTAAAAASPAPGRGGPATWFRTPLATLVLVGGDDADDYKRLGVVRGAVRAVSDRVAAGGGGLGAPTDWALLYVPPPLPSLPGGAGADAAAKAASRMFAALRADWSTRRHDRCVRVGEGEGSGWVGGLGALLAGAARASLEARRAAYEAEATAAAAAAAASAPSAAPPTAASTSRFAPLFLAKDSLAALLEEAGAADEALRERGELEALYLTHASHASHHSVPGSGTLTPPPPLPPGSDVAALVSASWRATRRAALIPGGPPDLWFRQALFAGQARLLLGAGRPGEVAGAGARFVAALAAGLAARRAAGRVPPLFPEAWSFSACVALVNAVGPALGARAAPGLVVAGAGVAPPLSPRASADPSGPLDDALPRPPPPAPPAYGPDVGWGLALASWLEDPGARDAAAATAASSGRDPAMRALLARTGDLAAAARDAFARLALGCVPGAADAGVRVRDDRLAGLAPAPLAAATPSPARRRGGGGGGGGGVGGGGAGGGHLVAAAAPGQGVPPADTTATGSAPGTPRSRSRLGLDVGAVAVHTLPLTPAGKGEVAGAAAAPAAPAPALASATAGSGSGRRLLQRAPELLRVRAAAASSGAGGSEAVPVPGVPALQPLPPSLDPATAEAAAESDADSSGGDSLPSTPTRRGIPPGTAAPSPATPPPPHAAHAFPPSPPPWVSDPRLVAGLASPTAAASLWLALTGAAVSAYAAAGRPRRAATLAAGAAPALRARGEHALAGSVLGAHARAAAADGWSSLAASLLPAAAADARAAGGAGVSPADALALLGLPAACVAARTAAQEDLEKSAAGEGGGGGSGGRPASSLRAPPPPAVSAGPSLTLTPVPGAFSRLAVGARAPPPGRGGSKGGGGRSLTAGGDGLRPPAGLEHGGGGAAAGSVGEAATISAALVSSLPQPLALTSLTLTLAVLQEVALERGGAFVTEWRETEGVEVGARAAASAASPTPIILAPGGAATEVRAVLTPLIRGMYALRGATGVVGPGLRVRIGCGGGGGGARGSALFWPGAAHAHTPSSPVAHEYVVLAAGPAAPAATLEVAGGGGGLVGGVAQWVGLRVRLGVPSPGTAASGAPPPHPAAALALHLAPAAPGGGEEAGADPGQPAQVGLALAAGAPVAVCGREGGRPEVRACRLAAGPAPPWLTLPPGALPPGAADVWLWATPALPQAPRLAVPLEAPPRRALGQAAGRARPLPALTAAAAAAAGAAPTATTTAATSSPPPSPRRAAAVATAAALAAAATAPAHLPPCPAPPPSALAAPRGTASLDAVVQVAARTHAARLEVGVSPPLDVGLRARRVAGGDAAVVEVSVRVPASCPWPVTVTGVTLRLPPPGTRAPAGAGGGAAATPAAPALPRAPCLTLTGELAPLAPLTLAPGAAAHFLAPASTAISVAGGGHAMTGGANAASTTTTGGGGLVEVAWIAGECAAAGAAAHTAPAPPPAAPPGAPTPSGTLRFAFDLVAPPRRPGDEDEDEGEGGGGGDDDAETEEDEGDSLDGGALRRAAARSPITIRLLGPFTGRAGVPLTLCWRLERGGRAGVGSAAASGAPSPPAPLPAVGFQVVGGAGWAPPSRLTGWALLPAAPGSAATVESAWTPLAGGPVRAPGLTVLSGGVGRDGGGGGAAGAVVVVVAGERE